MKIIRIDVYDNPAVSDELLAENVNKHDGEIMVELLNTYGRAENKWFKLVPDEYKLYDAVKELYGE